MLLTIFALGTLILVSAVALEMVFGWRNMQWLSDYPASQPGGQVSIIVAARNEEKNIREGLSSLLELDCPNKEIIVVNDRSTDRTGEILADMAARHPEVRVVTVSALPPGWLGKNHAQWSGAKGATGDLLLFTDADIVMEKTVLCRAIPYLKEKGLDHLAIGPRALMPGFALNLFMAGFAVFFNMFARPWKAKDPKSAAHVGIGAFNLLRRSAYEKIGTHQALAMRPDDDMKVGKLIKLNGLKQDFLIGTDMIFVEWYDSVKGLVEGLMKNAFSGVDYRLSVVIGATVAQLGLILWPFIAVFVVDGKAQVVYLAVVLIMVGVCALAAHAQGLNPLYGLGFPIATLAFLYIIWKATLRTLRRGGIEWRGTFYPLAELKRNKI